MNEADTRAEQSTPPSRRQGEVWWKEAACYGSIPSHLAASKAAGGLVYRSHKLAALNELRKSLLHQALSGQL